LKKEKKKKTRIQELTIRMDNAWNFGMISIPQEENDKMMEIGCQKSREYTC
jgi:hypothetical protein